MTECVTYYINFCLESTIPSRTVRSFTTNKLWITSDLRQLFNRMEKAFREGEGGVPEEYAEAASSKGKTEQGAVAYREKQESKLGSLGRANELNTFFQ